MSLGKCWHVCALVLALFLGCVGDTFAQNRPPQQPPLNQADKDVLVGFAVGWVICVGVMVVVGLVLTIWMIMFTLKDAKKRGMDPTIWIIMIVLLGWLGFVIYLCVREPIKTPRRRSREDDDDDDYDRKRRSRRSRDDDDDDDDDDEPGEAIIRRPGR